MRKTTTILSALSVLAIVVLGSRADTPGIAVHVERAEYVAGEPIGIVVDIHNPSSSDIDALYSYPSLSLWGVGGLSLDARQAGLVLRSPDAAAPVGIIGAICAVLPAKTIPAGDHHVRTLYLQRFVLQPGPGSYRVPFEVEIPLTIDGISRDRTLKAKGTLSFTILPADQGKLGEILERHAASLRPTDWLERVDAVEALSLVEDPIVIPHLVRMLHTFPLTEKALEALAKFPDHEQARAAVVDVVRSEDSDSAIRADVACALDILAGWRYRLDSRTIEAALGRDFPVVLAAMLDYLERVDPAEQVGEIAPSIAGLLDSGDPGVVTRAVGLLARWGAIDEDDARRVMTRVETMLVSGDTDLTLRTLKALKEARHKVAPAVLEELLNADEAILRSLARDYVIEFGIRGTSVDAPR